MTWKNAFDLGPCYVEVLSGGVSKYSEILGKGETSAEFDDGFSRHYTVSVTAEGAVQLNRTQGTFSGNLTLDVYPDYALPASVDLRVSGIVMPDGIDSGGSVANAFVEVALTTPDSGATWAPDPATYAGPLPADGWSVFTGTGS